jgi:hypothetical protein
MSFFDPKTQVYVDKTLSTLTTWFGGGTTPTSTPTSDGGNTTPILTPRVPKPQQDDNKPKTGLYIGIGAGVLAIVGVTIYLIKRKK